MVYSDRSFFMIFTNNKHNSHHITWWSIFPWENWGSRGYLPWDSSTWMVRMMLRRVVSLTCEWRWLLSPTSGTSKVEQFWWVEYGPWHQTFEKTSQRDWSADGRDGDVHKGVLCVFSWLPSDSSGILKPKSWLLDKKSLHADKHDSYYCCKEPWCLDFCLFFATHAYALLQHRVRPAFFWTRSAAFECPRHCRHKSRPACVLHVDLVGFFKLALVQRYVYSHS